MTRSRRSWQPYSERAAEFARRYESVSFERVHRPWSHLLADRGGRALDVGAGSGRDAVGLADRGFEVVAVEPAAGLRAEGRRRHPSPRIRWIDDALPELSAVRNLELRFGLILLSAVWMHVPPAQRSGAVERLADLLAPAGLLVVTLRHGEPDRGRSMHPVDGGGLTELCRAHALEPLAIPHPAADDPYGRIAVGWTIHVFRPSDDLRETER
ncbi:MAG TPA: class I SAM-dependent methyltransferase [Candidatus Polarisedimenticolaceae bacterium]|nr:class I SAM-dependent methyltransferase [Candidatus Polarisedimenticolaceae bacterium]